MPILYGLFGILRGIVTLIFKCRYKLSFEGKENIPRDGGYVYASNHRSYFDPVFITLPVRTFMSYMAKEELFHKNIFFTLLIKMMGAFPVERGKGDMGVIDAAIKKLEKKRNLVIFPEGTRSYTGKVGRGKTGVALIAAKAQRDVIPVGIIFEGPKLKPGAKVVVRFGKPIKAAELAISDNPDPRELKALKLKIMSAITELVEGNTAENNTVDDSLKEVTENE